MWLALLINAHQNDNQKPIGSAPAYRAQCTLPPQLIYQTLLSIFRGSGSETTRTVPSQYSTERPTLHHQNTDATIRDVTAHVTTPI